MHGVSWLMVDVVVRFGRMLKGGHVTTLFLHS
jgi:hypothetical protein